MYVFDIPRCARAQPSDTIRLSVYTVEARACSAFFYSYRFKHTAFVLLIVPERKRASERAPFLLFGFDTYSVRARVQLVQNNVIMKQSPHTQTSLVNDVTPYRRFNEQNSERVCVHCSVDNNQPQRQRHRTQRGTP